MTTLTSFSSLEISELEVKGLILSLFQVILVADGSNYLSHFFGTISHGNLKEITSTSPPSPQQITNEKIREMVDGFVSLFSTVNFQLLLTNLLIIYTFLFLSLNYFGHFG